MGKGATSDAGKCLFGAANVWWMCVQHFLLPLVARCLKTIVVCIWCMFVFMSFVILCGGLWEYFFSLGLLDVMDVVFLFVL